MILEIINKLLAFGIALELWWLLFIGYMELFNN